jgi:hypothetical protein
MTEDAPATGTGSTTTDQVKEQVTQKAEVAQETARGRLRDQVDQRSTQAGERLAGTAADVRSVAEELRRQGKDTPASMVEQAAGQATARPTTSRRPAATGSCATSRTWPVASRGRSWPAGWRWGSPPHGS